MWVAAIPLILVAMIRFLDGGFSLDAAKRPFLKPLLFLILAAFILSACAGEAQNPNWPGISAAGDVVYVAYGPSVLAYDVVEQTALWSYPTGDERSAVQFHAAPSVVEGSVVFGDYGKASSLFNPRQIVSIYGVSDPPGAPSDWINDEVATDKIIAPLMQVGNRAFVGTGDGYLLALDAESGEALWSDSFATENSIWGPMAFADGLVYVADMAGNIYAVEAETGEENGRWTTDTSFPGGLTLEGDTLFAGGYDNKVHAFDRSSPETELWAFDALSGIWGAPIAADGRVYFGDMAGNVYAVNAETGKVLWQKAVEGPIVTSPAFADGLVYIASEGDPEDREDHWYLTAFNAEDGSQSWQQLLPKGIFTTPVVVGDLIVGVMYGEGDDLLIAFDKETGVQQWTYAPER